MVQCQEEGLDDGSLGLLQTFLGLALALGCLGCGVIVVRPSTQCWISRQYLCQATLLGIGTSVGRAHYACYSDAVPPMSWSGWTDQDRAGRVGVSVENAEFM